MIEERLELRPKPLLKLRLAPQIRQTLRILPLSNIELASLIRKELEKNPFLEEREESVPSTAGRTEEEKESNPDWIEYLKDYERGTYSTQERSEPFPLEKLTAKKPTLLEHLLRQLRLSTPLEAGRPKAAVAVSLASSSTSRSGSAGRPLTGAASSESILRYRNFNKQKTGQAKRAVICRQTETGQAKRAVICRQTETGQAKRAVILKIGEQIIGNLDRNGYLKVLLNEIAKTLKVKEKEVAKVLGLIQTFDPIGVGARDIKECLLIQIKLNPSPLQRCGVKKPLVSKIIKEHLEDLGKRRYEKIAKALGVIRPQGGRIKIKEVQEAADFISTLEPKPGRSFGEESAQTVIPDIILTKVDKEHAIILNNEGLPRLQISPLYKKMLAKGSRINKEEKQYIKDRLNAAMGLIKAIDQREKTIYKITESIIKVQRDFLENGIDYLKPLTLKKIARDVGMHESTVSRVTSNKYIQTPQGVFELKYFFASGFRKSSVPKGGGRKEEITSSRSIKEVIKDLLDSEESKRPLSDQKIANILTTNLGINIARRTVAKYREEMRILPSHQRKRY